MTYPSFPTTVPPGDSSAFLVVYETIPNADGLGATIRALAASSYGGMHWVLCCDGVVQGIVVIESTGKPKEFGVSYNPRVRGKHAVSLAPIGWWSQIPPGIDVTFQQSIFVADKGTGMKINWDASLDQQAYGHSAQFSNWNLTGLQRYANAQPIEGQPTRGRMDLTMTTAGANHTVTLSLNGYPLASGTRNGNGTVTLSAQNNSGISGTVDLTWSVDLAKGTAYFMARWPRAYKIYVDGVLARTVSDIGLANRMSAQLTGLSVGARNITIRAVSDTQVDGTLTANFPITVPGRPEPPGQPVYVSGDYTNTVLQFAASSTGGASYRAYDSQLNKPTDYSVIAATALAGVGTISINLPSLGAAAAGTRRIVIESESGGIESGARRVIEVEYDAAGAVVLPRPNTPGFHVVTPDSGRTIQVLCEYPSDGEKGVGAVAQLFVVADGGAVNWATPQAEQTLGSADSKGIKKATLSYTVAGDGLYRYAVRVRLNPNIPLVQSLNTQQMGPELLSNAVLAAPGNVTVEVGA